LTAGKFELGDAVFDIRHVSEGKQFVVIGFTRYAVLETGTWRVLHQAPLPEMPRGVCSADINPAGTWLLRGDFAGSIGFTDLRSGKTIHRDYVFAGGHTAGFAFLPDGRHAAVINGSAHALTLWDTNTQTRVRQLRGHLLSGHGAARSCDGERLITGSTFPESAKIWDLRMDAVREVLNLSAPGNLFQAVGFSPDGSTVFAIENKEGAAYFWRAPSWEEIAAAGKAEKK
jgi:WD40 repeat protein